MTNNNLWWREGVIYQIYPRSFYDSSQDGSGDLRGIIEKLDYLESLAVDAIWLSPIFPSPNVDFGYDVSDYRAIAPGFGSMQDFDLLIETAHKKGIRIILDLVLNHTSDQHPWFVKSRSSRDNPYRDWYIWKDPSGGKRPNNWQSIFGGPGWEFDTETGQYYFHMFYKEQPDLNWRNPHVYNELLDVFRFWCDKGVDGFRLDVFNAFYKHKDFPDNPARLGLRGFDRQLHIYDVDQPELIPLLKDIRSLLEDYPERYAVGETFLESTGRAEKYCGSDLLHATFNFNLAESPWDAKKILKAILDWEHALAADAWPTQVLNNHDLPRSAARFGRGEDDERLKVAAAMLLTLRGTPFLYYGEEIGMRDIALQRSQILDPIGKRYWPFYKGRDGCRAPMQWGSSANAGFSKSKPWLPLHPNYEARNVSQQEKDAESLLNFYKQLLQLRRKHSALRSGDFIPINVGSDKALVYMRQNQEESLAVLCNFSMQEIPVQITKTFPVQGWHLLLSNRRQSLPEDLLGKVTLKPEEVLILCKPAANITP